MSAIVRKFPALALLVLAMVLGITPLLAVQAGLLPQGATQFGALSASLVGIILAAVEGRKGGVRELLVPHKQKERACPEDGSPVDAVSPLGI